MSCMVQSNFSRHCDVCKSLLQCKYIPANSLYSPLIYHLHILRWADQDLRDQMPQSFEYVLKHKIDAVDRPFNFAAIHLALSRMQTRSHGLIHTGQHSTQFENFRIRFMRFFTEMTLSEQIVETLNAHLQMQQEQTRVRQFIKVLCHTRQLLQSCGRNWWSCIDRNTIHCRGSH